MKLKKDIVLKLGIKDIDIYLIYGRNAIYRNVANARERLRVWRERI